MDSYHDMRMVKFYKYWPLEPFPAIHIKYDGVWKRKVEKLKENDQSNGKNKHPGQRSRYSD
jgi:hypothetical protein